MADEESGWLTVTEIARRLGRSPTTVKYWRDTFRDVLDERTDERGHALHHLAALQAIGMMVRQRTPQDEIRRALRESSETPSPPATAFERAILERLERIEQKVDWLLERERQWGE